MVGVMAFLCVAGASARSEAAFIAYMCNDELCSGGNDLIVTDNGAGDFAATADGVILAFGSYNGWEFLVSTSLSKPAIGSSATPQMDIHYSLTNTTDSAGALWLYASDTDFIGHVNLTLSTGGAFVGPVSLSAAAYGGDSNDNLDLLPVLITLGPITSSPFAVVGSGAQVGDGFTPYSLTIGLSVPATATPSHLSGNLLLTSVSEPASALLLGLSLLCGGAIVRRRRKATVQSD